MSEVFYSFYLVVVEGKRFRVSHHILRVLFYVPGAFCYDLPLACVRGKSCRELVADGVLPQYAFSFQLGTFCCTRLRIPCTGRKCALFSLSVFK